MESVEKRYRILVVDDDRKLCALVRDYLAAYGMECECVYDGSTGLARASEGCFDAVLLDMMLPGLDGLAVLKQLRSRNEHVPVVIISAQTDVSDRIIGLELGADDYVPKTFSPRELLARLRAVMRRTRPSTAEPEEEHSLSIRGLVMNNDGMEARLEGRNLELGTMEFRLLYLLASHPGHVFTRESLLEGIAGRWYDGFDRSIDMHISSLRRKLGDSPRSSRWIRTVRGNGYMFVK